MIEQVKTFVTRVGEDDGVNEFLAKLIPRLIKNVQARPYAVPGNNGEVWVLTTVCYLTEEYRYEYN
jgi:hypothetical protein